MRMCGELPLDHIFPIRDAASASLARVKADCLLEAGVIDARQRRLVYGRTASILEASAERALPLERDLGAPPTPLALANFY
jgi:hypothetical protein